MGDINNYSVVPNSYHVLNTTHMGKLGQKCYYWYNDSLLHQKIRNQGIDYIGYTICCFVGVKILTTCAALCREITENVNTFLAFHKQYYT